MLFVTLFKIVQGISRACVTLVGERGGGGGVMLGVYRPI